MSDAMRLGAFKSFSKIGKTHVWQLKSALDASAFFFASGIAVDADGAPKAYGPHNLHGTLDNLANAGHLGNWWGVVTDKKGEPVKQSGVLPKQPYKDFYISQTSLWDMSFDETDVRRWVDATKIPYIALPDHFGRTGLKVGDFALVINGTNAKWSFAIFADSKGKANAVGEISIAAAAAIGASTNARYGSMDAGIITLVFPNSGIGQGSIPTADIIEVCGRGSLEHFSTYRDKDQKLVTAFPEYPLFATALVDAGY